MYQSKRLEPLKKRRGKTESQIMVLLHKLTNCNYYIMELIAGIFLPPDLQEL